MRHMTDAQRMQAIALIENGWTLQTVANDLGVSKSVIFKPKKKWDDTHTVAYIHGGGMLGCL